jgi:exopolysaccharide biosynthesis polyprenyl glycosylphosphotransferase
MYRRHSENFSLLSMAIEAVWICLSLVIAQWVRPALSVYPWAAYIPAPYAVPKVLFVIFPTVWITIFLFFSLYDGRRHLRFSDEFIHLLGGSAMAAMTLAGILYLSFRIVSRLLFINFLLLVVLGLIAWRVISRLFLRTLKSSGSFQRNIIILGSSASTHKLVEEICTHQELGLNLVTLPPSTHSPGPETAPNFIPENELINLIMQNRVHDVIISTDYTEREELNNILGSLHRLPLKVWLIPDYFQLSLHKAGIENFAGIPMLDIRAPALNDDQRLVKRAFDLIISLISLPFIFILMGIIAVLIRRDSPGPIIFRQQRIGENSKLFNMLKFRTMKDSTDEPDQTLEPPGGGVSAAHKQKNDPRVTRIGRFLRHTSLDELPQIFNVIKGEMSLVGPRPELPDLVDRYEPWQRLRFTAPQGVTGWWQINGRSDKPMHLNTNYDIHYVQHYSIWLDFYILLKTIPVVLSGKGAF